MLASGTVPKGLTLEWNNFAVNPSNPSQPTQVNSKSLLWVGKHILHLFYPYSIFYPHIRGMATLLHSGKKTIVH